MPSWENGIEKKCSLTFDSLSLASNGQWQCALSMLGGESGYENFIDVTVAKPANVEFKDAFGTVITNVGMFYMTMCSLRFLTKGPFDGQVNPLSSLALHPMEGHRASFIGRSLTRQMALLLKTFLLLILQVLK